MAPDRAILLVLLALISSLIQSCQSIPEEIIVQEDDNGSELNQELFEHLVRSKREAVNNEEKLNVSDLVSEREEFCPSLVFTNFLIFYRQFQQNLTQVTCI